MGEAPKMLTNVFTYDFDMYHPKTMKEIGKKSTGSSPKKNFEKYQAKKKKKPEIKKMSWRYSWRSRPIRCPSKGRNADNLSVFNVNDHHQTDLSVRFDKIENPYIPLRAASLILMPFCACEAACTVSITFMSHNRWPFTWCYCWTCDYNFGRGQNNWLSGSE